MSLEESFLGKKTEYVYTYQPDLLFPVPRELARSRQFTRDKTGITSPLPFSGVDVWTGYELSWLNPKGKPELAFIEFYFPCTTENVVESKSLKLYLNSFYQTIFASIDEVEKTIQSDLDKVVKGPVKVKMYRYTEPKFHQISHFPGICLDDQDIEVDTYVVNRDFLTISEEHCEETVYSDLLKSNCMATGQPDWGSVMIRYSGPQICHQGLLRYIISFRNHVGFGEHCVEQIFCDLLAKCQPKKLTVYGRYTRRGGLDINPFRSNFEEFTDLNIRQIRQ